METVESGVDAFSIPVFPLNSVLFPGGVLLLKVFEARYLDMICRCQRDGSGFVVAGIRSGIEVGGDAEIFASGTLAKITDWDQLQNGLLGITATGESKVAVLATEKQSDQLLIATVRTLPEEPGTLLPLEFTGLADLLRKVLQDIGPPFDQLLPQLDDAGWVSDRLTELLPLALPQKQKLFEIPDALSRLHLLKDYMHGLEIL